MSRASGLQRCILCHHSRPGFRRPHPLQNGASVAILDMWQGGSSSVVECFLAKEDVAGSTPVSRSNHLFSCDTQSSSGPYAFTPEDVALGADLYAKGRGTQVVRERSAKPLCASSILARASKIFLRRPSPATGLLLFASRDIWADLVLPRLACYTDRHHRSCVLFLEERSNGFQ